MNICGRRMFHASVNKNPWQPASYLAASQASL
jgi:hypothetical protein